MKPQKKLIVVQGHLLAMRVKLSNGILKTSGSTFSGCAVTKENEN